MNEHRNIVMLTVDSLRADSCGFLGGSEGITPYLDRIAGDGLIFENAVAPGPRTPSSMPAIFTGGFHQPVSKWSYGEWQQRRDRIATHLSKRITIAEKLQSQGYSTIAFTANPWTRRDTAFDKGFDEFHELTIKNTQLSFNGNGIPLGIKIAGKILSLTGQGDRFNWENKQDWFLQWPGFIHHITDAVHQAEEPYFIWVFLLGPHEPYLPPREFRTETTAAEMYYGAFRYWYRKQHWLPKNIIGSSLAEESLPPHIEERLWKGYRDAIRSTDEFVRTLHEAITDDVVLIVHSDHGEAFGEHGTYGHQSSLYEENIHVPLLLYNTHDSGRVSTPISLRKLPRLISTLRKDNGETCPREFTSEFVISRTESADTVAVRNRRWKYISGNSRPELYDLLEDPRESENLASDAPEVVNELQHLCDNHRRDGIEKEVIARSGNRAVDNSTERL